jgi:phosphoribosylanthranilate isomerase
MLSTIQELFVKICGITNLDDARHAVACKADAVGFMFDRLDPRFIAPDHAAEIIQHLPEYISKIGVFVNADRKFIHDVLSTAALSAVQLTGREGPDDLVNWDTSVIKVFRLTDDFDVDVMRNYIVDAFLLDARGEDVHGKSVRFHWNTALRAKEFGRVILSGGLTLYNVEEAVRFVQPYGVDVCAGVEDEPGKKNPDKVREFIMRAKSVHLYYNDPQEE